LAHSVVQLCTTPLDDGLDLGSWLAGRGQTTNQPAGATVQFVIEAQANGSVGTILNTATLISATPDPVMANNANSVSLVVKGGTGKRR
jgi:hypothetical protein